MQPQNQRHLRDIPIVILTAILTAASVLLGVFAPYAAMMGAIGVPTSAFLAAVQATS